MNKINSKNYSKAIMRIGKGADVSPIESLRYKIFEVKSDDQNMTSNFQLLSFELIWYNIKRGVRELLNNK